MYKLAAAFVFLMIISCSPSGEELNSQYKNFRDEFSEKYGNIQTRAQYDSLLAWAKTKSLIILRNFDLESLRDSTLAKAADLLSYTEEKNKAVNAFKRSFKEWEKPGKEYVQKYLQLLMEKDLKKPENRNKIDETLSKYRAELGNGYLSMNLNYGYNLLDELLYDAAGKVFDRIIKEDTVGNVAGQAAYERAAIYFETSGKESALDFLKKIVSERKDNKLLKEKIRQLELVGKKAPEFDVKYWLGTPSPLKKLKGKVVMLDFWAPWCGPCRRAFPEMKIIYKELHSKGLEIVGLTNYYNFFRDEKESIRDVSTDVYDQKLVEFIKRFELPWPILLAEKRTNRDKYAVSFIPTFYLIDQQGIIRYVQVGTRKDKNYLKGKIESLLGIK